MTAANHTEQRKRKFNGNSTCDLNEMIIASNHLYETDRINIQTKPMNIQINRSNENDLHVLCRSSSFRPSAATFGHVRTFATSTTKLMNSKWFFIKLIYDRNLLCILFAWLHDDVRKIFVRLRSSRHRSKRPFGDGRAELKLFWSSTKS